MMRMVTYTGTLHQGKIELSSPIDLPDGSEVYVVAQVGIDPRMARCKANGWLVDTVGNLVMVGDGALVRTGDGWAWRFPAYLTSLAREPVGPIGHVDVDADRGDILSDHQTTEMMIARGAPRGLPLAGSG